MTSFGKISRNPLTLSQKYNIQNNATSKNNSSVNNKNVNDSFKYNSISAKQTLCNRNVSNHQSYIHQLTKKESRIPQPPNLKRSISVICKPSIQSSSNKIIISKTSVKSTKQQQTAIRTAPIPSKSDKLGQHRSTIITSSARLNSAKNSGISFKADPNSLRDILQGGGGAGGGGGETRKKDNIPYKSVSNFKNNYEQRRRLTLSSSSNNNYENGKDSRRMTFGASTLSTNNTIRNVANIVRNVRADVNAGGALKSLITPKKIAVTVSNNSSFGDSLRRLSLAAQSSSSREDVISRRKSLFPSMSGGNSNIRQSQSLFPPTIERRKSLFPITKSERDMQQVDDLLEKSKNLLRSIATTTPKKKTPQPTLEDPHEKEMAELLALERQLEMEISQLEKEK